MSYHSIEVLLKEIKTISKHYTEISKLTGEKFNVFRILKLSANEVRTHSAFIAELLDPFGSHSSGSIFLNHFLEIIQKKDFSNPTEVPVKIVFNPENVKKIKVEHWLGNVSGTDGGYIDILLTDKENNQIIIENKIYAVDQPKQILRYHNFDKSAPLIYLTLDGKMPSVESTGKEPAVLDKLICISYQDDILKWLDECKKSSIDQPIIRETIKQYQFLIKDLTNQSSNKNMEEDIINKIMSSTDYIESALNLNRLIPALQQNLIVKFKDILKDEFEPNYKIGFSKNLGKEESYISIFKSEWKNEMIFYFNKKYDLYIGFRPKEKPIEDVLKNIKNQFKNYHNQKNIKYKNLDWPGWSWWMSYDNYQLKSPEAWSKLNSKETTENTFSDIKEIIGLFEDAVFL